MKTRTIIRRAAASLGALAIATTGTIALASSAQAAATPLRPKVSFTSNFNGANPTSLAVGQSFNFQARITGTPLPQVRTLNYGIQAPGGACDLSQGRSQIDSLNINVPDSTYTYMGFPPIPAEWWDGIPTVGREFCLRQDLRNAGSATVLKSMVLRIPIVAAATPSPTPTTSAAPLPAPTAADPGQSFATPAPTAVQLNDALLGRPSTGTSTVRNGAQITIRFPLLPLDPAIIQASAPIRVASWGYASRSGAPCRSAGSTTFSRDDRVGRWTMVVRPTESNDYYLCAWQIGDDGSRLVQSNTMYKRIR